jgi:hypothetical protein
MTGKACKCEGFSSWADTWRGSRLCSYGMRPLAIERCCAIAIHTARAPPCQSKPSQNTDEPRVAKTMDMWCQPMHGTLPRPHPHRVPHASSASDDTNLIPRKRVESMRSAGGWGQRNDCGEGRQASCDATPNTRHPQRRSCRAEHKTCCCHVDILPAQEGGCADRTRKGGRKWTPQACAHLQLRRRPASKSICAQ